MCRCIFWFVPYLCCNHDDDDDHHHLLLRISITLICMHSLAIVYVPVRVCLFVCLFVPFFRLFVCLFFCFCFFLLLFFVFFCILAVIMDYNVSSVTLFCLTFCETGKDDTYVC